MKRSKTLERNRKGRLPDINTLAGIRALAKQLKSGQLQITDAELINILSIPELKTNPCEASEFVDFLDTLGSGSHGTAFQGYVEGQGDIVIKRAGFQAKELKDMSGDAVELIIFRLFSQQFVMTGLTPHLPPFFGSAFCTNPGTDEFQSELFIISRLAHYSDFYDFKKKCKSIPDQDLVIRKLLFELVWTFSIVHLAYPLYRHNDLRKPNVLITDAPFYGVTTYKWLDGTSFSVPNMGFRLMIWDFDYNSIVGLVDNIKPLRHQYENPGDGISTLHYQGADVQQFVAYATEYFSKRLSESFKKEVTSTWPGVAQMDILEAVPQMRVPYDMENMPPKPEDVLLSSPFFDMFKNNSANASYGFKQGFDIPKPITTAQLSQMLWHNTTVNVGMHAIAIPVRTLQKLPSLAVQYKPFSNEYIAKANIVSIETQKEMRGLFSKRLKNIIGKTYDPALAGRAAKRALKSISLFGPGFSTKKPYYAFAYIAYYDLLKENVSFESLDLYGMDFERFMRNMRVDSMEFIGYMLHYNWAQKLLSDWTR